MSARTSTLLSLLVLVAATVLPATAFAEDDDRCSLSIAGKVGLGFVVPFPGCGATLHSDVGAGFGKAFALGEDDDGRFDVRLFAEAGVLFPVDEERRWELGPVAFIAGLGHSTTNTTFDFDEPQTGLLLRARWWAFSEWITLDLGAGPTLHLGNDEVRPGMHLEFGPRIHAFAGGFISYDHAFDSNEHIILGGFNLTTGGAAMLIACGLAKGRC